MSGSRASPPPLVMLPRTALRAFAVAGIDVEAIARRFGAPAAGARMSSRVAHRIVAAALDRVDEPDFALRAGTMVRPELFGVVGFSIMAAPTFRDALDRLTRYVRVLGGGAFQVTTAANGDVIARRTTFAGVDPRVDHAHLEFEMSSIVAIGTLLTRRPLVPLRVSLRGPVPAHAAAYAAAFGVEPQLEARHDEVAFCRMDLDRPLVSSSRTHDHFFTASADRLLVECGAEPTCGRSRVRAALVRLLRIGQGSLAGVAASLGTSVRSLQRQLAVENTSFALILDDVRREIACARLATRPDFELAELAAMLGFSGTAALHRAFRRWEGTTPLDYRARHTGWRLTGDVATRSRPGH